MPRRMDLRVHRVADVGALFPQRAHHVHVVDKDAEALPGLGADRDVALTDRPILIDWAFNGDSLASQTS